MFRTRLGSRFPGGRPNFLSLDYTLLKVTFVAQETIQTSGIFPVRDTFMIQGHFHASGHIHNPGHTLTLQDTFTIQETHSQSTIGDTGIIHK